MNWSQFAILNCNLFLGVGYITGGIGPLILAIGWFFVVGYIWYTEQNARS
jgi:hypothetical protein